MQLKKLFEQGVSERDFYIYAETAFIHEGDYNYLKELIDAAQEGKCDGIKFQILLDIDSTFNKNTKIRNELDKWCFNEETWLEFIKYAKSKNLEVIVTPIDLLSIDFIIKQLDYIDSIEIHSACINDYFFLKRVSEIKDTTIILGIGGRTLEEIDYVFKTMGSKYRFILMTGFQNFPTTIENINLFKIKLLLEKYSLCVGYADHTKFDDLYRYRLVEFSYILGARVFEKHITINPGEKRVDFESAIDYKGFLRHRSDLNLLQRVLGSSNKYVLNSAEIQYRNREKQLVYSKNMNSGEQITYNSLAYKITSEKSDFKQNEIHKLVGCRATKDLLKDSVVKSHDIDLN